MILTYDAVLAFRDRDGDWGHMGLGTLVLVANAVLLWLYSLSCHSCRHIVGGRLNSFSRHPLRYRFWTVVSRLNGRHMQLGLGLAVRRRAHRPLRLPAGRRRLRRSALLLTVELY